MRPYDLPQDKKQLKKEEDKKSNSNSHRTTILFIDFSSQPLRGVKERIPLQRKIEPSRTRQKWDKIDGR